MRPARARSLPQCFLPPLTAGRSRAGSNSLPISLSRMTRPPRASPSPRSIGRALRSHFNLGFDASEQTPAVIEPAVDPDAPASLAMKAAIDKLPLSIGKDRVGSFNGRDAVWKKIAELHRASGVGFVVVTDSAKDQYGLNRGNLILKGRANEIDHDGFRKREVSESMPHAALMLFIGEQENVSLYLDKIGDLTVAKIVKQGAAYSGELAPFDALQQAQKSTKETCGVGRGTACTHKHHVDDVAHATAVHPCR